MADGESEDDFIGLAQGMTAAQLERTCRLYRQVTDPHQERASDVEDRRWVSCRDTDDGMVSIQLRLLPTEAAKVMKAIEQAAGDRPLVDGAVSLADVQLEQSTQDGRPPVEVVVRISAETLHGETELGDGLSATTARRLLCDAGVVPVLEDAHGQTLDVGRKSRSVPAALKRALRLRDEGCRFPGCTHKRFVDAHHIEHWVDGGETKLDNLVLLCRAHHRYLHEYGCRIERLPSSARTVAETATTGGSTRTLVQGDLQFFDRSGRPVAPAGPRRAICTSAISGNPFDNIIPWTEHDDDLDISADSNLPHWDGLPVDYDECVQVVASRARARHIMSQMSDRNRDPYWHPEHSGL